MCVCVVISSSESCLYQEKKANAALHLHSSAFASPSCSALAARRLLDCSASRFAIISSSSERPSGPESHARGSLRRFFDAGACADCLCFGETGSSSGGGEASVVGSGASSAAVGSGSGSGSGGGGGLCLRAFGGITSGRRVGPDAILSVVVGGGGGGEGKGWNADTRGAPPPPPSPSTPSPATATAATAARMGAAIACACGGGPSGASSHSSEGGASMGAPALAAASVNLAFSSSSSAALRRPPRVPCLPHRRGGEGGRA
mmetsp:Transcript_24868/g.81393  ORF Transcript_24868/g.81393 Transcript_24868/m.81393 type:complete len:260 (-) Transcript_24868:1208-1987(-)